MTGYVALLRAVNVGGRQLKMADLKGMAADLGLGCPETYIASGNLLFTSNQAEGSIKAMLERRLEQHMGAPVGVMLRTAEELAAVIADNPFVAEAPNTVVAIFLDEPPPADTVRGAQNVADERLALGSREIYVHFPNGQGRSKLKIAAASRGTARNMNTVAKLAELSREM